MILNLYIENIAVIEKVSIDFSEGFNIMTGETGAGKSIVLDSISLILGNRAPKDIIRTGAKKAFVSATFDNLSTEVAEVVENLGYQLDEDGLLIIQREISLNGKGFCKINSRPATVSSLKQIGKFLINIHGQHESLGLLSPDSHLSYIDRMGELDSEIEKYKLEFNNLKKIKLDLDKTNVDEAEKARKVDLLKFQINEIEEIAPVSGEDDELKEQRDMFMNSEKISSSILSAKDCINGSENNSGAVQLLETALDSISSISSYMPSAESLSSRLRELLYELEDCSSELNGMYEDIEYNPNEVERVEQRLDSLYRLTRKYGSNIDEVLQYLKNAKGELEDIEFSEVKIEKLRKLFQANKSNTLKLAEALSEKRKKISEVFCEKVKKELEFLAMPGVEFHVSMDKGNLTSTGFDNLEFLISTNPGEFPKPISKIASGGELSRIMLAVKNVLSDKDDIVTLIFDEVDTGISGAVAQKVGFKLKEVSQNRQVICVTHSAQIAALADVHFLISKNFENDRTYTSIAKLNMEGRKKEIARIIGGTSITDATLANASEMLYNGIGVSSQ